MKRILKIIGLLFLIIVLLGVGFGIYTYLTNEMLRAIVNNDESKLYYFPSKEISRMDDLTYSEKMLNVEDTIKICTYQFENTTQIAKANIFFIHGAGGNVSFYQRMIKTLTENGFKVYAMDWRGYGKSNGTPNYKGVLKDTEVAFTDFLEKTKNDSLKVIVYGMSLGGQIAVKITKDNQNKVNALILDSSIESAQSLAIDYAPIEFLKEDARNKPKKFNQDYVAIRDIKEIINIPKLVIHSKKDKDVPFVRGENLFKAAKEPKEFWITETEHVMILVDNPKEAILRIEKLIE
jgi:alpha-beta hydrolase superfamily lysophospholipase